MKQSNVEIIRRKGQGFFVERRRNGTIKNLEKVLMYEVSGALNLETEKMEDASGLLMTIKRQKMNKSRDMPYKTILRRIE